MNELGYFDCLSGHCHETEGLRRRCDERLSHEERRKRRIQAAAPDLYSAALLCLDANGHLRGCEAGAGTDGNEDNCTAYCTALRRAVAKVEGRQP